MSSRHRNKEIHIRLTDQELELLRARVACTDLTQQEFCLRSILDRNIPPPYHPDLAPIRRELNAIGNNVNQLARAANSGVRIPHEDALIIERSFSQLENLLMEVLKGGHFEE